MITRAKETHKAILSLPYLLPSVSPEWCWTKVMNEKETGRERPDRYTLPPPSCLATNPNLSIPFTILALFSRECWSERVGWWGREGMVTQRTRSWTRLTSFVSFPITFPCLYSISLSLHLSLSLPFQIPRFWGVNEREGIWGSERVLTTEEVKDEEGRYQLVKRQWGNSSHKHYPFILIYSFLPSYLFPISLS